MVITVASGKGGTGKTTVAANLAVSITESVSSKVNKNNTWILDCDVEAPNAALFINPELTISRSVKRLIPEIDPMKCTACGQCAAVCAYNALAVVNKKVIFFKELCHACGSCARVCPEKAIIEREETVGILQQGAAGNLQFAHGTLSIGFSSPVPVIRELKKWILPHAAQQTAVIIDSSPGTACPVVEALRGADFALLVTEPTPFGLHDLKLIVELVQSEFKLPCGVVINKSSESDFLIEDFCKKQDIPILMRIPLSRDIAVAYARGEILIKSHPQYKKEFINLYSKIENITSLQLDKS